MLYERISLRVRAIRLGESPRDGITAGEANAPIVAALPVGGSGRQMRALFRKMPKQQVGTFPHSSARVLARELYIHPDVLLAMRSDWMRMDWTRSERLPGSESLPDAETPGRPWLLRLNAFMQRIRRRAMQPASFLPARVGRNDSERPAPDGDGTSSLATDQLRSVAFTRTIALTPGDNGIHLPCAQKDNHADPEPGSGRTPTGGAAGIEPFEERSR